MIRSSASLMAEDITVRCRLRRSSKVVDPEYGESQEFSCTLRNWEHRQGLSLTSGLIKASSLPDPKLMSMVADDEHHTGPELLLTPVIISHRDESPLRRPGKRPLERPLPFSIPISNILVVETYNVRYGSNLHKLTVTTKSYGLFEFNCSNTNGHDILLAFLQASLPPERIIDGIGASSVPDVGKSSSCDFDRFTARKVRERGENETWPEKLSRRMGKVVNSLQEISLSLCEATCCRPTDEVRDLPPMQYNELGLEEEVSMASPSKAKTRHVGLSMESDPELTYVR